MRLEDLPEAFLKYYRSFKSDEMHDLKYAHTCRVVDNARFIMEGEGFRPELKAIGTAAAWLHDVGRFGQFEKYRTFSDAASVNHALLSCCEILQGEWLDDWPLQERHLILRAIEFHNLRDLPPHLAEDEAALCHLVRDADKLDIFTVLEEAIRTKILPERPDIYWGLPFSAPPSEVIVQSIHEGRSIHYADVKSFADFVFIQLAWCHGGLHFSSASRLALERGVVDVREDYLCEILPQCEATIRSCCCVARGALERHAMGGLR